MNKGIATIDDSYASLIKRLYQNGIPFIVTSFGSPYLPTYDYIDTYLAAYGYGSVLVEAAANALLTDVPITGRLPVELNKELKRGDQILVHPDSTFLEKADISYSLSIIDSAVEAKIFPGAQVYISQHGKTILSKGFGYHTYYKAKEVSTETIFDLASITKVLSATPIVMKLVNDKELNLDQPLSLIHI